MKNETPDHGQPRVCAGERHGSEQHNLRLEPAQSQEDREELFYGLARTFVDGECSRNIAQVAYDPRQAWRQMAHVDGLITSDATDEQMAAYYMLKGALLGAIHGNDVKARRVPA